jgi:hypothetical protein
VLENRVLRRIFALKMDAVIGGWRKLHIEELHNAYSSPRIIKMIKTMRMRWTGHVAHMGEKSNTYRYRWEKNVKMDLPELGESAMDQTHLAQGRAQW